MIIVYNSVTHVSEHLLPFSPVYTSRWGEGMLFSLVSHSSFVIAFSQSQSQSQSS